MDNFVGELTEIAKLPFNEIYRDFKLIFLSNKIVYLSNFVKVLNYSYEKIDIRVNKNKCISFSGKDLQICQINRGEIIIKGVFAICDFGENNEK